MWILNYGEIFYFLQYFQAILDTLNKSFEAAVFLYDHEIKDNDEILESLGKKKKITKSKSSIKDKSESKAIQVSIFLPCVSNVNLSLQ